MPAGVRDSAPAGPLQQAVKAGANGAANSAMDGANGDHNGKGGPAVRASVPTGFNLWGGGAIRTATGTRGGANGNGAASTDSKSVQSVQMTTVGEAPRRQGPPVPDPGQAQERPLSAVAEQQAPEPRLYEQWDGDEKFFCGGRCMSGPDWKMMFLTASLVLVPAVIFIALVAADFGSLSYIFVPISAVWALCSLVFLFRTSCMDPGVIPRRPSRLPSLVQPGMSRVYEVYINGGRPVQIRYNDTARVYQPPRAHHCSINDNCYDKFDHHCPWTGTTIALRNYRSFLFFIMGTLGYIVWTCAICAAYIARNVHIVNTDNNPATNGKDAAARSGAAIAILIYCLPATAFLLPLTGLHCFLVSKNRTTYENFKYARQGHPFDLGSCGRNWWSVCCVPTPPPHVRMRGPASQLDAHKWWCPHDPWEQNGQVLEADDDSEPPDVENGPSTADAARPEAASLAGQGTPGGRRGLQGLFGLSRPGTPTGSRPGTPGGRDGAASEVSVPAAAQGVGVEMSEGNMRRAPMSEPSEQDGGQGRWTLDQTLGSAQKALRKSVGLLGWGSATDVSVAGSQADPQGRQTPTGQRSR